MNTISQSDAMGLHGDEDMRRRAMWRLFKDFGWNYQEIGDMWGCSRAWVSKLFTDAGNRVRTARPRLITPADDTPSRHYNVVVKRAKVGPAPAAPIERRAPIVPPTPAGKHPVHGVQVRRFEEGTFEQIITRVLEEHGHTVECKWVHGQGRDKLWFLDDKRITMDALLARVDAMRAKKGFPPLAKPKTKVTYRNAP